MGIRETFLRQTGDLLICKLNSRMETLKEELIAVKARRLDAWTEGDLSENSAYHEAEKTEEGIHAEMAAISKRESELDDFLGLDYRHSGFISIGSVVTLMYENGRERTIMIVPDQFSELELGWIATGSPIGVELESKQAGDTVTVIMPKKTPIYKVLEVD